MNRIRRKGWCLAGALAAVYAVMILFVWFVQTRSAEARLSRLMDSSVESAIESVDYNVEPEALRVARILVAEWGSSENAARVDLQAALDHYDCEEINIVGPSNIIVAAANPAYIGFDMASGPYTAEFGSLLTGERSHVTQRFRQSKCGRSKEKGGLGLWLKYVALPFPEGGYLQLGDSYRNFRTRFNRELENLMRNASAGENGYFLLVDRELGTILSGFKAEWSNRALASSGIEAETFATDGEIRLVSVFGVPSYVRRIRLKFADMDVYVVIPQRDILAARDLAVVAASVVLGFVLLFGGLLFSKVVRQHERIEALYARESERIEKDLAMAKAIQINAMPSTFPPYPAFSDVIDLHALMRPAREVGGDFYDFYFVGPNRIAIVIADVSGKGIPAALFMMRAKATIQSCLKSEPGIVEAMTKANHRLSRGNDANMFVTAWIGIADLTDGTVEYINAGHNPPLIKSADGSVEFLARRSGPALAAVDGAGFARQSLKLAPGEGIILYTDGVTEAMNRDGTLYGSERLLLAVKGLLGVREASEVTSGILKNVDVYSDGAEQADDITILGFKLSAFKREA